MLKTTTETVKEFIKDPRKWLIFHGNYGTGKTMMMKIIKTAYSPIALYISSQNVEAHLHESRQEDGIGAFQKILLDAPILLIDDVGAEYGGQLVATTLERVIDYRYEQYPSHPTVVATNLGLSAIRGYVPRAADRLGDKMKVKPVNMKGTSFRSLKEGQRHD
jgi:DNA replication protein DnaC